MRGKKLQGVDKRRYPSKEYRLPIKLLSWLRIDPLHEDDARVMVHWHRLCRKPDTVVEAFDDLYRAGLVDPPEYGGLMNDIERGWIDEDANKWKLRRG